MNVGQQKKETLTQISSETISNSDSNNQIKIGGYILNKSIGNGTFGKVYVGIHVKTGEKVAIKAIDKTKLRKHYEVEKVQRQIKNLSKLRHGSIIQLYEHFENKQYMYLIMEYMSQGELFNYIVRNKKLQQQEACQIFHQILLGVEYSHKCGVAHRDLKPQNILIDYDRTVKIIDFGLSGSYKPNEKLQTCCGSPCYVAPEMISGKEPYEPAKVDIWSMGVILYAMLCGCLPFVDDSPKKIYEKIIAGHFKVPKTLSTQVKNLLSRIFTLNPSKRITIQEIKSHPWMEQSSNVKRYGIIPRIHCIPIDDEIINLVQGYGINIDKCREQLYKKMLSSQTALYYIILKKSIKGGRSSDCYLGSNNFNPQLLYDKNLQTQIQDDSTQGQGISCDITKPPQGPSSGSFKYQDNSQSFKIFPAKVFPTLKLIFQRYEQSNTKMTLSSSRVKIKKRFLTIKQVQIFDAYVSKQYRLMNVKEKDNKPFNRFPLQIEQKNESQTIFSRGYKRDKVNKSSQNRKRIVSYIFPKIKILRPNLTGN